MYRNRINPVSGLNAVSSSGVYGSSKAGTFLKDALNNTDSVDVVIFGDSNAGSPGYSGYTSAWSHALSSLGIPLYATPIGIPSSTDGTNNRTSGMMLPFNQIKWIGRSEPGGIGTAYTLSERAVGTTTSSDATTLNTSLLDGYYVTDGTATASSSTTLTLASNASSTNNAYVGYSLNIHSGSAQSAIVTAYNGTTKVATVASWSSTPSSTASYSITKVNIRPYSFSYSAPFVPASSTYTSPGNGSGIKMAAANPLVGNNGSGGNTLQYRVVYAKFGTSGGTFRLAAMTGVNTLISGATQSPSPGSTISTYSGSNGVVGYGTATLDFTTTAAETTCSWDGYYNGGTYTVNGPFACFYQSVIRKNFKGYSVSCLNYCGGFTTANLASQLVGISGNNKLLEMYLKELRERQIAAGGTGRVLWWHCSGINGPDSGSTWTTNCASIRDTVYNTWIGLGYPASDLAFVMAPTHPTITGDAGDVGWGVARSDVMPAAVIWANSSDNVAKNVCVVDIEKFITASQLKSRNLYQVLGDNTVYESHLREAPQTNTVTWSYAPTTMTYSTYTGDAVITNNGYNAVVSNIIRNLLLV